MFNTELKEVTAFLLHAGSEDVDDDDDNADLSDEEGGDGDAAERKGRARREQVKRYTGCKKNTEL